ncbi:NepR family anti-sigma factor [Gluconacetobacter tumulisoli]|uniref:Anti-sigma factor NepR domain-containing protein n=1 Tax=Gluconacetobacter tumulisoli TaxID=1286189 RepID=A0A7W4K732_9PROT|nr:NepR family anti-sigma factor [Gluconacetobacter tumulisoli]MBB2201598.1 hypothetical protein [Gluconacetobacter tumulisoli]
MTDSAFSMFLRQNLKSLYDDTLSVPIPDALARLLEPFDEDKSGFLTAEHERGDMCQDGARIYTNTEDSGDENFPPHPSRV